MAAAPRGDRRRALRTSDALGPGAFGGRLAAGGQGAVVSPTWDRLAEADAWATGHQDELNRRERDFLEASRRAAAGELDAARRSNRRLRLLVAGLGLALLGAIVAGVLAVRSSQEAESQSRLALARVLATQAERLLESQPDVAILVGLQSLSLAREEEPESRVPAALVTGLARQTHASWQLTGHGDQVHQVAYAPDGRTLASASWDGTIRFWNARTGRPLGAPLRAEQGKLTALAFSPDGRKLASGGEDGDVRLWDAGSRRPSGKPLEGPRGTVHSIAFSPNGEQLASAGDDAHAMVGAPLRPDPRPAPRGPHRESSGRGLQPRRKVAGQRRPGRHGSHLERLEPRRSTARRCAAIATTSGA